jgi:hypothetical protein
MSLLLDDQTWLRQLYGAPSANPCATRPPGVEVESIVDRGVVVRLAAAMGLRGADAIDRGSPWRTPSVPISGRIAPAGAPSAPSIAAGRPRVTHAVVTPRAQTQRGAVRAATFVKHSPRGQSRSPRSGMRTCTDPCSRRHQAGLRLACARS